jgi:hypothetical protein
VIPKRHLCSFWSDGDCCKHAREQCYNAHGVADQYCRFGFACLHRRDGLCALRHPPLDLDSRVHVAITYWDYSTASCHLEPMSYTVAGTVLCSHVHPGKSNERFYCVHLDRPWFDFRAQGDWRPSLCAAVHSSALWRCENIAHATSIGSCVIGASEQSIVF